MRAAVFEELVLSRSGGFAIFWVAVALAVAVRAKVAVDAGGDC